GRGGRCRAGTRRRRCAPASGSTARRGGPALGRGWGRRGATMRGRRSSSVGGLLAAWPPAYERRNVAGSSSIGIHRRRGRGRAARRRLGRNGGGGRRLVVVVENDGSRLGAAFEREADRADADDSDRRGRDEQRGLAASSALSPPRRRLRN